MRKISLLIFMGVICFITSAQLSLDENDWTILTPSDDSRIIYVSSSEGSDDNDGLSESSPVASLSMAVSLARNGYPDYILFKRGDEWYTKYGIGSFKSGRSATEPMVLSYYGESGARPRFNIECSFFSTFNVERSHLVFMGLEWYGYKHDPNSPDFSSTTKVGVFSMLGYGENYLIEDCVANYVSLGAFAPASSGNHYENVKLRYVIAFQSYGPDSYTIHELYTREQGIYVSGTEGFLMEHCLMDHNGWNEQVDGSGPNMFNHNLYMSGCNPDPSKIILRDNIFARGAAHGVQLRSGGLATGNLFIQNAVNMNVGYDYISAGFDDMLQWVSDMNNTTVSENVIVETRYMDSSNWDYPRTAARMGINGVLIPCRITNNIIAHSINKDGTAIGDYEDINGIGGTVEYSGNIIHGFYPSGSSLETTDPGWFDPERKIAHYHRKLGKEADTKAFLLEARKRPLKTKWPEYSAEIVNAYLRDGFTILEDITAPENIIEVVAENVTDASAELHWNWAIDNQRTIGYNVYIDDQKVNTGIVEDTFYFKYELNPETEYTVVVTTVDVAGNESSGTQVQFTTLEADHEFPTTPTGLSMIEVTDHSFTLSWQKAMDNMAIWGYHLYIDDVILSDSVITDTCCTVINLEMGKSYQVAVSALDPAGNESGKSEITEIRVLDSEPPSLPENLYVSDNTSSSLIMHWDPASDNVAVALYRLYIGITLIDSTTGIEYEYKNLEMGERYSFGVSAVDMDGNESEKAKLKLGLGLEEEAYSEEFNIYPNPAENYISICCNSEIESIKILDISGKVLKMESGNGTTDKTIGLEDLAPGFYLIRISGDNKNYTGHFLRK